MFFPPYSVCRKWLDSTNNCWSSRHTQFAKYGWIPQKIIILIAINSVQKLVWNPQIIVVLPVIKWIWLEGWSQAIFRCRKSWYKLYIHSFDGKIWNSTCDWLRPQPTYPISNIPLLILHNVVYFRKFWNHSLIKNFNTNLGLGLGLGLGWENLKHYLWLTQATTHISDFKHPSTYFT